MFHRTLSGVPRPDYDEVNTPRLGLTAVDGHEKLTAIIFSVELMFTIIYCVNFRKIKIFLSFIHFPTVLYNVQKRPYQNLSSKRYRNRETFLAAAIMVCFSVV